MSQIQVLYEDDVLLAIDKPSGMPSVAHSADDTQTASAQARLYCPALAGVGPKAELEAGLLHRLDNGTSGVLLFAKTQSAFDLLRAAWKTPTVDKLYRAVVQKHGDQPLPRALPLRLTPTFAHDAKSARKMRIVTEATRASFYRGKPLPTLTVLETLEVRPHAAGTWDAQVRIHTGVQHQIRLTLAHLGLPILGDETYGEKGGRLWLHHWRLRIAHPVTGQSLLIEAPLPWA